MQKIEQVRQRAFHIWEAAGRPNNTDLDNWLQAERDVLHKKTPVKKTARKSRAKKKA